MQTFMEISGDSLDIETKMTSTYSATDSTGFYNSSERRTLLEEKFKWTSEEIARLLQIIVRPILVIIGTIGNGLTIYIMRKTSLKNLSSCFYMSVLALADTSK